MLTEICGDPGTGKTKLATALGVANMSGLNALKSIELCKKVTRQLQQDMPITENSKQIYTGNEFKNFIVPDDHIVYADYPITLNVGGCTLAKSHDIDGFKIGLWNPDWETVFLPPGALVILDEAQFYYDSKRATLPQFVVRFYEIHRHNYYDFIFVCQRPVGLNKGIRGICQKFIFIEEFHTIEDSFGNGLMTTWNCVEFNNTFDAERYSDTKSINGKKTVYQFIGDINKCYDPQAKFATHYYGRENQVYTQEPSKIVKRNPAEIKEYNNSHPYEVPEIFLKQAKPNKEEMA